LPGEAPGVGCLATAKLEKLKTTRSNLSFERID
jgi:hypothetical protein